MVDFHSHILPGIDDGSANIGMTKQMLTMMHRQGVQAVVATPHFYPNRDMPDAFLERRDAALALVSQLEGEFPRIIPGAEVAYFDGIGHSNALEKFQIGNTRMVLVEMPFCRWTPRMIRDISYMKAETGMTPVLAHIDRYRRQLKECFPALQDCGVLFQCNAEPFLSVFHRRWALQHLERGSIHFLGTDAHNLTSRPPRLKEAYEVIRQRSGTDTLDLLDSFARQQLSL